MRAWGRRTISRWIADRTCLSIHPSIHPGGTCTRFGPTLVDAVSSGLFANADRNQRYTTRERYGAPTVPNRRCWLETRGITLYQFHSANSENVLIAIITFSRLQWRKNYATYVQNTRCIIYSDGKSGFRYIWFMRSYRDTLQLLLALASISSSSRENCYERDTLQCKEIDNCPLKSFIQVVRRLLQEMAEN